MSSKNSIAGYISLLKGFPSCKKSKRRQPYLRIKFLENKKVFFNIFIQKILQEKYSGNDKMRRLECIHLLPKILSTVKPTLSRGEYCFQYENIVVIIKRAKNETFHLLTLYPK